MKLIRYPTAEAFLTAVEPTLMADEAKNNLILGIAGQVAVGRSYGEGQPYFLSVHDEDRVVAAAIRTPPYNVILYCDPDRRDALERIADHLLDEGEQLPGAHGTVDVVGAFAETWTARTGRAARVSMSQRVYCLTEVTAPVDVPGRMRWAEEQDVPTLAKWFLGFIQEAVPEDPPADPEANVRRFMSRGALGVWETDHIVSMAGSSRGSKNGSTVSAVYTPRENRGKGYASACVAALSQAMLDAGSAFCTLYTDLSNPTSNKIYQNVGYQPVADFAMYEFTEPGGNA